MKLCDAPVTLDDGVTIACGGPAEWETPGRHYCREHKHRIHADGETQFRRVGQRGWTFVGGSSVVG